MTGRSLRAVVGEIGRKKGEIEKGNVVGVEAVVRTATCRVQVVGGREEGRGRVGGGEMLDGGVRTTGNECVDDIRS
jgi:hypothetical protein